MPPEFTKEIIDEKNRQRLALRNEYIKKVTNPHAEAGYVFDPAVQRFVSSKVSKIDFFRETPLNILRGMIFIVIPLGGLLYFTKKYRDNTEAELRAGKVAYKDRLFKLV